MPNDSRIALAGKITYAWNPFQDNPANRVVDEPVTADVNGAGIIVPRCGPFFSRDVKIVLTDSDRELSFQAGDFSFLHPFGRFNSRYNRLVWGAIQLKNVSGPVNAKISYDTIGGDFVLNENAYAEAVANTLTAPRVIDWSEIVNLPLTWPADPHDHPASDTMNWGDMIVFMQSYIDAITNNPGLTWSAKFKEHVEADLAHAHSADLKMLGINNLGDWAMANDDDLKGNSTELLMNVATTKNLIRAFLRGEIS